MREDIVAANFTSSENLKGGCETVFDQLRKALDCKFVNYEHCAKALGQPARPYQSIFSIFERGLVVDSYLEKLEKMGFKPKLFVKNSTLGGLINLKTPQISWCQDPYKDIARTMFDNNLYDHVGFYEFFHCYGELQKHTLEAAERIIVPSEYMKGYVKEHYGLESRVINHGINTEFFKPIEKAKELLKDQYKIPKDKPIGLWSGTAHPVKNWHMIANCINLMKDIHWVLIFKEHHLPGERDIQSKNASIFKSIPPRQCADLYNLADFCINLSPHESFGLVPLEAMSCGTPIVTTPVGFFNDFWDERAGYRLEDKDGAPAWQNYDSIEKAVKDIIKGENSFAPRDVVISQKLTVDRFSADWKKVADEVIEECEKAKK